MVAQVTFDGLFRLPALDPAPLAPLAPLSPPEAAPTEPAAPPAIAEPDAFARAAAPSIPLAAPAPVAPAPGAPVVSAASVTAEMMKPPAPAAPSPVAAAIARAMQSTNLTREVPFTAAGLPAKATLSAVSQAPASDLQKAHDRATSPAKNAWLTTSGKLQLGGPAKSGNDDFVDAGLSFSQTRPYRFDPNAPNPIAMAEAVARNNGRDLPLSAAGVRKMELGSKLALEGHLRAGASVAGDRVDARVGRTAKLEVERRAGNVVKADLALGRDDALAAATEPLTAGKDGVAATASATRSGSRALSVELDLDTKAGREAMERLLRFDPSAAAAGGEGVKVLSDKTGSDQKLAATVSGQARVGPVSASGSAAIEKRTTVDAATGTRTESGKLSGKANLSTMVGDARIGFDGSKDRSYSFAVPGSAEGSFALPLDAQSAAKMPAGAKFELHGNGAMKLAGADGANKGEISNASKIDLAVAKTGASTVRVDATLHREKNGSGAATVGSGTSTLAARASARSTQDPVLEGLSLDLAQPTHARAYDALLRGDARGAIAIGATQPGVASGKTVATDQQHVEGTLPGAKGTLDRQSTVEDDGTTRKESGALAGDLDVQAQLGGAKLGFQPTSKRSFALSTPSGAGDVALPLDADRARALPKGAVFTLDGQGTVGASVDTRGLSAGTTRSGAMALKVERGEGDQVQASLKVTDTRDDRAKATPALKGPIGVTASHELHTQRTQDVKVALDLSKTADRAAYDAMVRGDAGPAAKLAEQRGQAAVTTTEHKSEDQLGVTATPIAGLTIGASAQRTVVSPSDPSIAGDALKQATSAELAKQGRDARWTRVESHLDPSFARSTSGTFGGSGTFGLGIQAGAKVGYDAIAPTASGASALQPPTRAADLVARAPGSAYHFHGEAHLSAEANAAITGAAMPLPGVGITAKAELAAKAVRVDDLDVKVTRLAGSEARVELAAKHVNDRSVSAALSVGVTVDPAGLLAQAGPLGQIPKVAGEVGAAAKRIEDAAKIGFETKREDVHHRDRALDMRFDLSKLGSSPRLAQAYEESVRGRPELALAMADETRRGQDSGVKVVKGEQSRVDSRSTATSVSLGGSKVYLSEALRSDTTVITEDEKTRTQTDTSLFKKKDRQLYGDRREVAFTAVNVATTENPAGHRYYQLSMKKHDALTSRADVEQMERLAAVMGARPSAPAVKKPQGGLQSALGRAYGKTDSEVEVYFTEKGLDKVRHATKEQAIGAYADTVRARHGDAALPPWAAPADRREADDFYRRLEDAKRQDAMAFDMNSRDKYARRVQSDYAIRFGGRDIERDAQERSKAEAFGTMVARMGASEDPVAWNKAFADFGKKVGFDTFGVLGAWNKLAGADEVLVHKLGMKGSRVSLQMADEGVVARP